MRGALALIGLVLLALSLPLHAQDRVRYYSVVALPEPPEGGMVEGGGVYREGETATLTAEPNFGYRFVRWREDGEEVSTSPVIEFVVERDRELVAEFERIPLEIGWRARGNWSLSVLPSPGLKGGRLEFSLTAKGGTDLSGELKLTNTFSSVGWTGLRLDAKGRWRNLSGGAGLTFDPRKAEYRSAYFMGSASFQGVYLSLRVNHRAFGGVPPGPYLTSTLTVRFSPFYLTLQGEEREGGMELKGLLVRFTNLPLCCGLSFGGCLSFTKEAGFSYFSLTVPKLLKLCCGITVDVGVKFTPTAKEITLRPRITGLGEACLRLYGNVVWDGDDHAIEGIELYGFRIRCCLDCGACPGSRVSSPYLELTSALDPHRMPGGFRGDEFEYWKIGFCGPTCCGGYYALEITAYFGKGGGLLGFSRLRISGELPIPPGIKVRPVLELGTSVHSLELGTDFDLTFR